jgi:hypothetical protein
MSDWRIKLTNQVSKRPLLKAGRNDKVLLNLFLLNLFLLRYILSKFMKRPQGSVLRKVFFSIKK